MENATFKTKDGKEINLSFLNRSKGFRLGMKAGKEGWGQEGGAWQKNGAAFRTGWWAEQCLRTTGTMTLPYTEQEIKTAIEEDINKDGDARLELEGEPTGLYFTFLVPLDGGDVGYHDVYRPNVMLHLTMESVAWERDQFKGSRCELALIAFETHDCKPENNGTPLMLDTFEFATFIRMLRWAKEQDEQEHSHTFSSVCQCIFKMMFAERIMRKWLIDGRPEDEYVKVLTT